MSPDGAEALVVAVNIALLIAAVALSAVVLGTLVGNAIDRFMDGEDGP